MLPLTVSKASTKRNEKWKCIAKMPEKLTREVANFAASDHWLNWTEKLRTESRKSMSVEIQEPGVEFMKSVCKVTMTVEPSIAPWRHCKWPTFKSQVYGSGWNFRKVVCN